MKSVWNKDYHIQTQSVYCTTTNVITTGATVTWPAEYDNAPVAVVVPDLFDDATWAVNTLTTQQATLTVTGLDVDHTAEYFVVAVLSHAKL